MFVLIFKNDIDWCELSIWNRGQLRTTWWMFKLCLNVNYMKRLIWGQGMYYLQIYINWDFITDSYIQLSLCQYKSPVTKDSYLQTLPVLKVQENYERSLLRILNRLFGHNMDFKKSSAIRNWEVNLIQHDGPWVD